MNARVIPLRRPNRDDVQAHLEQIRRLAHRLGNRVLADLRGTQDSRLAALAEAGASAQVAVDLRDGQVRVGIVRPDGSEAMLLARGWPCEDSGEVHHAP